MYIKKYASLDGSLPMPIAKALPEITWRSAEISQHTNHTLGFNLNLRLPEHAAAIKR